VEVKPDVGDATTELLLVAGVVGANMVAAIINCTFASCKVIIVKYNGRQ